MTQSRKHAPRMDDELERQVEGHLQGQPGDARVEGWRESEPADDRQPQVSTVPYPDPQSRSDVDLQFTPKEIEDRSRLGQYLPRTLFPANREELLRAAEDAGAPDDVLDEIRTLPADQTVETPARAWAALTHKIDQRF